mmetsp:Transcript_34702/g.110280  ORF Transcript_34702/g.110280 Transcript_34702/m.110280 type:complete len:630 (-) Transcript_34702:81-1970(-)
MRPRGLLLLAPLLWASTVARAAVTTGSVQSLESLKRSVLRISVYRKIFYWSRPYDDHTIVGSLGSGFLVSMDPPTICTCAHVVTNAHEVYVQVTKFGRAKFEASVATIDYDTDIALLVLKKPRELFRKLGEAKISLQPLKVAERTPELGHSVLAPGFPLGQKTLTLSMGVISGVDHVDFHHRNLALQSTAIISPGNSGSPLLDADSKEVIGMNYAKQSGEAQINYAVALWRLKQAVLKHKQVHNSLTSKNSTETPEAPYQLRLVEHGLVITPGLEALYKMSGGNRSCHSGPLISAILPDSPFQDAKPPVHAESFLVSVDGVALDRYGQGSKPGYVEELVDFDDLMTMRDGTGEEDMEFETCDAATGRVSAHHVSLAWRKERQGKGVRYIHNARVEGVTWEIFGDLLFMELSENHVRLLGDAALYHLLEPEERQHSRLAALIVREGGEAEEALGLSKGQDLAIVESVNGHKVASLEEFRQHFEPPGLKNRTSSPQSSELRKQDAEAAFLQRRLRAPRGGDEDDAVWSMRTSSGKEFAALFKKTLTKQAVSALYGERHLLTLAAESAMERLELLEWRQASLLTRRSRSSGEAAGVEDELVARTQGLPLEVVRREERGVLVDFARGEGFDAW